MKTKTPKILFCWFVILAAVTGGRAQTYTAMRLTTPTGESITPQAVADGDATEKVRVVGGYSSGGKIHACLWTAKSFLELRPYTAQAWAYVINNKGQIYGSDWDINGFNPQLVGWNSSGGAFALSPPGYTLLGAITANNLNAVVSNGYKIAPDGSQTEYGAYVLSNGLVRLLPLSGDTGAEGYGINDSGWVVGRSNGSVGSPVVWMNSVTPTSLGTLGGTDGWAFGINNNGQAVGYSADSSGHRHAFLWQNGVMTQLPGGSLFYASASNINDSGVAVGVADRRAVSWTSGQMTDLNGYAPAADNVEFKKAIAISPNGAIIVTGDVIGSGGTPANYVIIPKQTTSIAVDLDHDGMIQFDDASDKTSASTPFVFWTNDDVDLIVGKDEEDADPSANPPDYQHSHIACKRDLEDFERIWLRAPSGFDPASGQWSVKCSMEVSSGAPGINVWATVTDSAAYLSDTTIADQQIATAGFGILTASTPIGIDPKLFVYQSAGALYVPLLFDGRTAGTFAIDVKFSRNGAQVSEDRAYFDIRRMSDLYDHFTAGDTTTIDVSQIPATAAKIQSASIRGTTNDYVLFVHGWRMKPWERRAFAETAYKRLWHLGYQGGFGLYSWPTEYVDGRLATLWKDKDPLQNYDRSEQKAWNSAPALRQLLHDLTAQGLKVHLLAHSMGNIVASEALELEGESGAPQLIAVDYAATQAATVAQAYDPNPALQVLRSPTTPNVYAKYPPRPATQYYNKIGSAGKFIYNLHNRKDYALGYWLTNQKLKPDIGWGYSGTLGFYRSSGLVPLNFPQYRAEIFSFVAQAWSNALGREPSVQVNITSSVDLNATFQFGNGATEHSAEFNSTIMQRAAYWSKLGALFNISLNPFLN